MTTAGDSTAKVWRTSDFKLVCELKDSENSRYWIWDTAFSADSKYLFTGSCINSKVAISLLSSSFNLTL